MSRGDIMLRVTLISQLKRKGGGVTVAHSFLMQE
jgi:hypothetical protein